METLLNEGKGDKMAKRLFFRPIESKPYYEEIMIEFDFFNGFSKSQKVKSIKSIHKAIIKNNSKSNVLEISSSSEENIGIALSAFNLKLTSDNDSNEYNVENVFQASKVFETAGPFTDLLKLKPWEAKKDIRLKTSGYLKFFRWNGIDYPLEPKTLFYDWIYVNAIMQNEDLIEELLKYNCFTDIEFNHKKSINCQARSAAIFVTLYKHSLIKEAISSIDNFKKIYECIRDYEQLTFF